MNKIVKILLWSIGIIAIIAISAISYITLALPNVGSAPDIKVDMTPERISRGEYLANHVTVCIDCHSTRDWTKFSGPPKKGTFGMGGEKFDQSLGFPGKYYARNITPAGISQYTDGELFRLITTGVNKQGKALFPVMPFHYYGQMDQEDIKSIIAYIRTLQPIENNIPQSESDFPMNIIINTIPHKPSFTKLPSKSDQVQYGKYLVNAAACIECHTPADKGQLIPGKEFSGGRQFQFPNGLVISSNNITPDKETGLGNWTEMMFVDLFKKRSDSTILNTTLQKDEMNTIMPWTMYGKMNEEDLKAIYHYLQSIKPIKNFVAVNSNLKH